MFNSFILHLKVFQLISHSNAPPTSAPPTKYPITHSFTSHIHLLDTQLTTTSPARRFRPSSSIAYSFVCASLLLNKQLSEAYLWCSVFFLLLLLLFLFLLAKRFQLFRTSQSHTYNHAALPVSPTCCLSAGNTSGCWSTP